MGCLILEKYFSENLKKCCLSVKFRKIGEGRREEI